MRKLLPYLIATLLGAFGLLTLFMSASVLFDLFEIRAKQGQYVPFVVWANFVCSILYLLAAYGILVAHKWTTAVLSISSLILVGTFIGLLVHVNAGGLYETRTIGAMIFRITITLSFTVYAFLAISRKHVA